MALIYATGGILLLTLNTPYMRLPGYYKIIFGLTMIFYAVFRTYRLYKIYSEMNKDTENEF